MTHEQTHSHILIEADVGAVMDVIADVEAYPEWIPGLDEVVLDEVFEEDERPATATFHAHLSGVKGYYTVEYFWEAAEVSWHMTRSDLFRDLHGSYVCSEREDGFVDVEYRLETEFAVPVVGMLRRRGEKAVVDSALKGLKKRVEA